MSSLTRIATDIAVRGGVLLAAQWSFTRIWDAATPGPHGTDIGGGLVGLLLVVLAALTWGGLDGRTRDLRRLMVTWVGAGLVSGLFAAGALVLEGGQRGDVLVAVAIVPTFLTAVIAGPALLAGAVSRGRASRTGSGQPG